MSWRWPHRAGAALAAALLLTSCDRVFRSSAKDDYALGLQKEKVGDFRGAASIYESALDGTGKTAEAHFRLALLYADKWQRPADAIHHFNRYLELTPTGQHAKDVQTMRKDAERRLALGAGQGTYTTQETAVLLKNDNLRLSKELVELRAQKALPAAAPGKPKKGETAQKPAPPGARLHTVKAGETLSLLAQKYYKNKGKAKDIQDANFYATEGTTIIKPGQTLIIP